MARTLVTDYKPLAENETTSRAKGYESGLHWSHNNVPGGPWKMHASPWEKDDAAWVERCAQSQRNHAAWIEGWWAGLRAQNPNHPLLVHAPKGN